LTPLHFNKIKLNKKDFLEETLESNLSIELQQDDDATVLERLRRAYLITDMQSRRLNILTSGATAVSGLLRTIYETDDDADTNTNTKTSTNTNTNTDTDTDTDTANKDIKNSRKIKSRIFSCANVGDSRAVIACHKDHDLSHIPQQDGDQDEELDQIGSSANASAGASDLTKTKAKSQEIYKAYRLTYDHRAEDPYEQTRINNAGGFITRSRVLGILAVSRSFGDHGMKDYVTADPYLMDINLTNIDAPFFILACDGVWDVFTDQQACNLIFNEYKKLNLRPFTYAAEMLVQSAIDKGSADNITAIVVFL
jgi:protein phosphatase PTC1